jgi:hypothetical protein
LIVEINAKEFVDWLFGLPLKKLIKPMRAAQAIAVARRLAELANSQPEFYFLWDLAADVWRLLLFVPDGRVATNEQCTRFLNDYRPYFLNRDLKTAVAAIDKTADVQGPRIARNPDQIEYRLERPVPLRASRSLRPANQQEAACRRHIGADRRGRRRNDRS